MGASYSGLYEEGKVEHINVPPLPIPMVSKPESWLIVKGISQMGQIQTVLTRKKTKVPGATVGFKATGYKGLTSFDVTILRNDDDIKEICNYY